MKYLVLYYPEKEGLWGIEPSDEERFRFDAESDEEAKERIRHLPKAHLYKEVILQ